MAQVHITYEIIETRVFVATRTLRPLERDALRPLPEASRRVWADMDLDDAHLGYVRELASEQPAQRRRITKIEVDGDPPPTVDFGRLIGTDARSLAEIVDELWEAGADATPPNVEGLKRRCKEREDELHSLADDFLSVWEGSNGKEGIHVILSESDDFRAAQALVEIDKLADDALTIYRRRVPEGKGA